MTDTAGLRCPSCQAPLAGDEVFCEQCGVRLADDASPDGSADRIELDLQVAAAVSDRGRVHRRNEDAFRLNVADEHNVALVVCDGISTASAGNVAAQKAASSAGAVLARAIADPGQDASVATEEAIRAAAGAVELVPWTTRTRRVDPSCTLVSAVYRGGEIVIGWVGDSRAYSLDDGGPRQLTVDDSFAEESVAEGLMTPEQAARSPFLHSITNWVGPAAPERPPRVVTVHPEGAGTLILCTDGFWNYLGNTDELGELIGRLPVDAAPVAIAHALTDVALERGGQDNITVGVVRIDPST